jgi:hypothetical protein
MIAKKYKCRPTSQLQSIQNNTLQLLSVKHYQVASTVSRTLQNKQLQNSNVCPLCASIGIALQPWGAWPNPRRRRNRNVLLWSSTIIVRTRLITSFSTQPSQFSVLIQPIISQQIPLTPSSATVSTAAKSVLRLSALTSSYHPPRSNMYVANRISLSLRSPIPSLRAMS